MRRRRRVSSCTATTPMPGRVTARKRSLSPTRIAGGRPLGCLLRSRNEGTAPVFFLKRGKPTRLPRRFPDRESDQALSARPQSTAASSNTCWHTWVRHANPVTTVSAHPFGSTANTRPASSVFFHALNALIRSNPVHGTSTSGSRRRWVSAVFTRRRHWLNANRAAPACRANTSCCSTVGSRQKRNVVCRVIAPASIPPATDKSGGPRHVGPCDHHRRSCNPEPPRRPGASTSTPRSACCAPAARGGTCRTISPWDGRQPTSISCAGAAAGCGLAS